MELVQLVFVVFVVVVVVVVAVPGRLERIKLICFTDLTQLAGRLWRQANFQRISCFCSAMAVVVVAAGEDLKLLLSGLLSLVVVVAVVRIESKRTPNRA